MSNKTKTMVEALDLSCAPALGTSAQRQWRKAAGLDLSCPPAAASSPTLAAPTSAPAPNSENDGLVPGVAPDHRRARKIFLVVYITLLQMLAMFSIDLYSPALPGMTEYFQTSESMVNLTLVVFFIFELFGMLIFGPISDRFGRKPVLLTATVSYLITSLACTLSQGIWSLIVFRALQAIAVGAAICIATALVKDCFTGRTRENVLVLVQAIFMIGPIAAPVVGAQLLQVYSWRACFALLVALGVFSVVMTLIYRESLPVSERLSGSFFGSFSGLAVVARNRDFMIFMLVTTTFWSLPFLAYLTVAAFIYEGVFNLTALEYSYFFAATAGVSVLGLLVYKLIERRITVRRLTTILLLGAGGCGAAVLFFGGTAPVVFCLIMMAFQTIGTVVRPYATNILFDLQKDDTGAASSMMNCSNTLIGVIGLLPVVALAGNYILSLSVLLLLGFGASLALWLIMLRSSKVDLSRTCTPPK